MRDLDQSIGRHDRQPLLFGSHVLKRVIMDNSGRWDNRIALPTSWLMKNKSEKENEAIANTFISTVSSFQQTPEDMQRFLLSLSVDRPTRIDLRKKPMWEPSIHAGSMPLVYIGEEYKQIRKLSLAALKFGLEYATT